MFLQRRLNKAEVSTWNFKDLEWNAADQCNQNNPTRPEYQCAGFATYAVLFVSTSKKKLLK